MLKIFHYVHGFENEFDIDARVLVMLHFCYFSVVAVQNAGQR